MIAPTSFRRPILISVAVASALLGLVNAARAQGAPYRASGVEVVSYGYADSYAGPLLRGDFVGAPLTRFPRPSELVPSAWGYGTYGIPTVAGIRNAPVGTPTVYVIDTPPPARAQPQRRIGAGRLSRTPAPRYAPVAEGAVGGARVITLGAAQRPTDPR